MPCMSGARLLMHMVSMYMVSGLCLACHGIWLLIIPQPHCMPLHAGEKKERNLGSMVIATWAAW